MYITLYTFKHTLIKHTINKLLYQSVENVGVPFVKGADERN